MEQEHFSPLPIIGFYQNPVPPKFLWEVVRINEWYYYFRKLADKLLEFIAEETSASLYYQQLAALAPGSGEKELLRKLAKDEARHAAYLRTVYRQITGRPGRVLPASPPSIDSYQGALRQRLFAESNDYLKYGDEFLTAPDMYLRCLFYKIGAAEAQHGMILTILLSGSSTGPALR